MNISKLHVHVLEFMVFDGNIHPKFLSMNLAKKVTHDDTIERVTSIHPFPIYHHINDGMIEVYIPKYNSIISEFFDVKYMKYLQEHVLFMNECGEILAYHYKMLDKIDHHIAEKNHEFIVSDIQSKSKNIYGYLCLGLDDDSSYDVYDDCDCGDDSLCGCDCEPDVSWFSPIEWYDTIGCHAKDIGSGIFRERELVYEPQVIEPIRNIRFGNLFAGKNMQDDYLYFIELSDGQERMYKVGRTFDVGNRMKQFVAAGYNPKTIQTKLMPHYAVVAIEGHIHEALRSASLSYNPKIDFGGKTECYVLDAFDDICAIF